MRGLMRVIVAAAVVMLLVVAPAYAQVNPTVQGYSAPAGTTQQQITSTPSPTAQVTPGPKKTTTTPVAAVKAANNKSGGGLPFTGLELGLVLAAGGALLGVGLGLRRVSRTSETA
jgi:hypothetical protein